MKFPRVSRGYLSSPPSQKQSIKRRMEFLSTVKILTKYCSYLKGVEMEKSLRKRKSSARSKGGFSSREDAKI